MNAAKLSPIAFLTLTVVAPARAHHGVAPHYDVSKPVRLEGVVASFEFINPHSFVHVATTDENGAEQTWACEMASRSVLSRNGLTAGTFRVGEPITIEGVAGARQSDGLRVARRLLCGRQRVTEHGALRPGEHWAPPSFPEDPASIAGRLGR